MWESNYLIEYALILHPYCTSRFFLNENVELGIFGQINTTSKNYSIYTKTVKNLSFIVPKNILFKEINFFDEYTGNSIPNNCTSLCLEFVFQSNEHTL